MVSTPEVVVLPPTTTKSVPMPMVLCLFPCFVGLWCGHDVVVGAYLSYVAFFLVKKKRELSLWSIPYVWIDLCTLTSDVYVKSYAKSCCSTRFRSEDLWVMSPTRFLCATEHFLTEKVIAFMICFRTLPSTSIAFGIAQNIHELCSHIVVGELP